MKRIVLVMVVLVLIIGGWYAYAIYQEKTPDVVGKEPEVVTTAKELLEAFDKDTADARKKYIDKIVEVSGTVKRIDTTGSVVLGEEGTASEVTIGFDRRHIGDYKKIKEGAMAKFQGVCSGYDKGNSDDLLASLGTTVELRSAGVKAK
jgi:hypothetical protein